MALSSLRRLPRLAHLDVRQQSWSTEVRSCCKQAGGFVVSHTAHFSPAGLSQRFFSAAPHGTPQMRQLVCLSRICASRVYLP